MPNVSRELLEEAFVKPIRFALLLDDQFPTYIDATKPGSDAKDSDRARRLFEMCREKGWLCDIDNGIEVAERFERTKHMHQSDLLVLDYHLDAEQDGDPSRAISILQSLAKSQHFNLVIIYTSAEPKAVARDVAYCLGAGDEAQQAGLDFWDEIGDADKSSKELTAEILDAFLRREKLPESTAAIRNYLEEEYNIVRQPREDAIKALIQIFLRKRLPNHCVDGRLEAKLDVEFIAEQNTPWVQAGNLFVAVVQKTEKPEALVGKLVDALSDWNPRPLRVLMMHARATLEKAGSFAETAALGSSRKQAGLLLHLLLSGSEGEKERRLIELYSRLSSDLARSMDGTITQFGKRLFARNEDVDPITQARDATRLDGKHKDGAIYHALNEYLCLESSTDEHVTTGVIFSCALGNETAYWLCAAPACDMVPGRCSKGMDEDIAPLRPVAVARLKALDNEGTVFRALQSATNGRHIFFSLREEMIALEVADSETRQMELDTLFLEEQGKVVDGAFNGFVLERKDGAMPTFSARQFRVEARLRPEYANRLLAQAGQQRGRIGVDFWNAPLPVDAEPG
ncbi:response regulator receiver domain [Luteibacter sp.]|uniref:response regulator receiver domain n=1 Tax=Luteibacter sp. TaxID=1886636 RepID=UPI0028097D39|nr:response regulator receiver domain [Luteibacter sp.]MDQ8049497.1 response regulator receiver domain [Luteibacter sp.]